MQTKHILALSLIAILSVFCNAKNNKNIQKITVDGNTEVNYTVGYFNKISSSANTRIVFTQAKKCSIKFVPEGNTKMLPSIEVADSTLKLNYWSGQGTFYVTAPDLRKLNISGMSTFTASDLNLKNLTIKTNGQSATNLTNINCTNFGINASGVSSNSISGNVTAKKVHLRYSGNSVANIASIKADTIRANYTGLSSQKINFNCLYLNMDIHGNVSLSGNITADNMYLNSHGLSNIDIEQSGKNATIHNHGSATLKLQLNCEMIRAKNSGLGNIILSGVADSTKIISSGNSHINTFDLNKF